MSSRFTLGCLPNESLGLFRAHSESLCKTELGREEVLEAAMLFSTRLIYQKSKLKNVKDWVEILEEILSYHPGFITVNTGEPGIDWRAFAAGIASLTVQMQGHISYLEHYSTQALLRRKDVGNLLGVFNRQGNVSLEQIVTVVGHSRFVTVGLLNSLLDARLLEYSSDEIFCLTAEGREVAQVL